MQTIVNVADDLDLRKIQLSGQCFRVAASSDGLFRLVAKNRVLFMQEAEVGVDGDRSVAVDGAVVGDRDGDCDGAGGVLSNGAGDAKAGRTFAISCTRSEWDGFWHGYLDLGRSYSSIRERAAGKSEFIDAAMAFGCGLRVLRQDPWEMLVTFIISQRKSIPAIATSVEAICKRFGSPLDEPIVRLGTAAESAPDLFDLANRRCSGGLHAFPEPEMLARASEAELRECGVGYRARYIAKTARMVASGELDLQAVASLSDEELFAELKRFPGVGDKVASCVALFGYGRSSLVPVDVWIARAINTECAGCNPFEQFGEDAGIMQQYVFHYMTQRERG